LTKNGKVGTERRKRNISKKLSSGIFF